MQKTKLVIRNISLEPQDYRLIQKVQKEKGFGGKGFSAALRFIVRDWYQRTNEVPEKELSPTGK